MRLAVFQPDAGRASLQQRLQALEDVLAENRARNVDLVLCPELYLSGFSDAEFIRRSASPIPGYAFQRVADIAIRHGVAIAAGYPEKCDDGLYNSAFCISSTGHLLTNHRKRILPTSYEKDLFRTGNQISVFDLGNGWRAALLICYEVEFPETVRACAVAGAQLVLVPTALGREWGVVSRRLVPTRAFENGVFLAYSNFTGSDESTDYIGDSVIVSPTGEDLARAGTGVDFLTIEISKQAIARARSRLPYLIDHVNLV